MNKNAWLLFLMAMGSAACGTPSEKIPGFVYTDSKSVFELAKSKNQIIMIDFYTTWCKPCKMLEKEVYRAPDFKAITDKLICTTIDAEKDEGVELAARYQINAYPTIIFVDPDGKEISRMIGFDPGLNYLKEIDKILTDLDHVKPI